MRKMLCLFSFLITAVLFFAGCQSNVVGPTNHNSAAISLRKAQLKQSVSGSGIIFTDISAFPHIRSEITINANKYSDGSVDGTFSLDNNIVHYSGKVTAFQVYSDTVYWGGFVTASNRPSIVSVGDGIIDALIDNSGSPDRRTHAVTGHYFTQAKINNYCYTSPYSISYFFYFTSGNIAIRQY